MSRKEMNPMERWRKNQRDREKKKKKLKQKEMKERENEVPLQMQIKRDNYWKTQEENKKKRDELLKKELRLQGKDADLVPPSDIYPPIEAPPPEKYEEIYYECIKDKNEDLYPEQTFIIHTIKKQLALKKKNLRMKIKIEEEKAFKEHQQVEVQKHIVRKYEEEKARKRLLEEEKERRQNLGKEVGRGIIISTPKFTQEYIESLAPEEKFTPVSVLKKKVEEEGAGEMQKRVLDDIQVQDIVVKKKKVDKNAQRQKEILDVPMPGLLLDQDDDDFLDSDEEESQEENPQDAVGDELKMLEEIARVNL